MQLEDGMCEIESDDEWKEIFLMARCNFLSKNESKIPNWLFIDTGSTCSMIRGPSMLLGLLKTSKPLDLITNGGPFDVCVKGMFMDKMLVLCSKKSVSN